MMASNIDPLLFDPDEGVSFSASAPTMTAVRMTNTSSFPVDFKVRTTHPGDLFSRPIEGTILPRDSSVLEMHLRPGFVADNLGVLPKMMIQYHERRDGDEAVASAEVFSKKISPLGPAAPPAHLSVDLSPSLAPKGKSQFLLPSVTSSAEYTATATNRESVMQTEVGVSNSSDGAALENPLTAVAGVSPPVSPNFSDIPIAVYVRMRRTLPGEGSLVNWTMGPTWIRDGETMYTVDRVLSPEMSNSDVFRESALAHRMRDVISGINVTLFAYGHTSSGKTHTILGTKSDGGLALRSLCSLIDQLGANVSQYTSVVLNAAYFEVYNEQINDLLRASPSGDNLSMRTEVGGFSIVDLTERRILSIDDGTAVVDDGDRRRKVGKSHANDSSSRSHTVFRVTCSTVSMPLRDGSAISRRSEVNFVDLAGSETLSERGNKNETLNINLSLTHLKRIITQLSKREKFVSYRSSTLTMVLKQALGGNSRTLVVCTVAPPECFHRETRATLLFGTLAKTISTSVAVNQATIQANQEQLAAENRDLKEYIKALENRLDKASGGMAITTPKTTRELPPPVPTSDDNSAMECEAAVLRRQLDEAETQLQTLAQASRTHFEAAAVMKRDLQLLRLVEQTMMYLHHGCCVKRVLAAGGTRREFLRLGLDGRSLVFVRSSGSARVSSSSSTTSGLPSIDGGNRSGSQVMATTVRLANVHSIVLGRRAVGTGGTTNLGAIAAAPAGFASMPITLEFGAQSNDVSFIPESVADCEAWVVCLGQLTGVEPRWEAAMPVSELSAPDLLPAEREFCSRHHIPPVGYMTAKSLVFGEASGTCVSVWDVRTQTPLDLLQAELVCRFFVSQGWLMHMSVLTKSIR